MFPRKLSQEVDDNQTFENCLIAFCLILFITEIFLNSLKKTKTISATLHVQKKYLMMSCIYIIFYMFKA